MKKQNKTNHRLGYILTKTKKKQTQKTRTKSCNVFGLILECLRKYHNIDGAPSFGKQKKKPPPQKKNCY